MKNLRLYAVLLFFVSLSACQTENEIVNIHPDENWFQSYSSLMVEENYTVELVRKGSLTMDELGLINSKGLEGQELIAEYADYISKEELDNLLEYNSNLNSLFQAVNFRQSDLQRVEVINVKSVQQYSALFTDSTALRSSKKCEEEAGSAAGTAFLGGLAGVGAAAAGSAGTLVVPAVITNIAASLIIYASKYKSCKNKEEKEKEDKNG